jgi:hypothetical protein
MGRSLYQDFPAYALIIESYFIAQEVVIEKEQLDSSRTQQNARSEAVCFVPLRQSADVIGDDFNMDDVRLDPRGAGDVGIPEAFK